MGELWGREVSISGLGGGSRSSRTSSPVSRTVMGELELPELRVAVEAEMRRLLR